MEKLERKIEAILNDMDMDELVYIWNQYCEAVNYMDDMVEAMDSFDELMSGKKPHEIAQLITYGDFNYGDDWFAFNGYGNLISFDYAGDKKSPIDTKAVAEYAVEQDDDLGSADIRELLDGTEEGE